MPTLAATAGGPTVIQPLKSDTSPALRTLHATAVAPSGMGNHSHRPLRPGQKGTGAPTASNSIQTTLGAATIPSTNTNFEGINNLDNVLPPDTNGDIGPNNYVQWVNLQFEIFDRTGASLLGPTQGNTLWSGFGGVCDTTNQGDPVVKYDRVANRWVFTQFAFSVSRQGIPIAPFVQCFAVSTTGDPTGTYYRYAWTISSTYFPDYPKLAVWTDAYYMTVNYFSGNTFVGGGALAFDRTKMLAGQPATGIGFGPLGSAYGGLLPSDFDGSILPPTGSPNYFGAVDTSGLSSGNTFQIWKFHVDFITPTNSTFGTATNTPNFNLAVATYSFNLCGFSRNCIQQPASTQGLDPIPDRLMNRLQYRRFADGHESLVANHTVGVGSSGNQAAIRWYEIRGLSSVPAIYQQGTYSPSSDNRWMGSIAMDQAGDIALGYSVSSTTVSPSIRYTGRLASDPLGTLPQGEATLIAGSGSQTSNFNRWGDYSMMAVDPTDDCTFWYTQEYYTTTSDRGWQTRIGSFKFPNCGIPVCPTGWSCADLGSATPTGSQSLTSGSWTIQGGGADIWGTNDQFHFVWQSLAGDGGISARVVSQTNTNIWAKAGVMLRQSSASNSAYYAAVVTASNGIVVQYRPSAGATALWPVSLSGTAPAYLQVGRVGSTFTAYTSNDGATWTAIPGSTVTLSMSGALLQGLAVTSHNSAALSTVTADSVSLSTTQPPPAPAGCLTGWNCADVGNATPPGGQVVSAGTWTIQGGGTDIWNTSDQFHFAWQSLAGDGGISARVVSQTNTNVWAKAGVMLRQSTNPNSAFYAALVTPGNGIVVQYRPSAGASALWPATLTGTPPAYLQVGRVGSTFTAYTSNDGLSWTAIPGSAVTLSLSGTLLQGLAVTAHNAAALSTVTLDAVKPG